MYVYILKRKEKGTDQHYQSLLVDHCKKTSIVDISYTITNRSRIYNGIIITIIIVVTIIHNR